jgi:hypothetical protein
LWFFGHSAFSVISSSLRTLLLNSVELRHSHHGQLDSIALTAASISNKRKVAAPPVLGRADFGAN